MTDPLDFRAGQAPELRISAGDTVDLDVVFGSGIPGGTWLFEVWARSVAPVTIPHTTSGNTLTATWDTDTLGLKPGPHYHWHLRNETDDRTYIVGVAVIVKDHGGTFTGGTIQSATIAPLDVTLNVGGSGVFSPLLVPEGHVVGRLGGDATIRAVSLADLKAALDALP